MCVVPADDVSSDISIDYSYIHYKNASIQNDVFLLKSPFGLSLLGVYYGKAITASINTNISPPVIVTPENELLHNNEVCM